jgi:hypothetical protein
LPEDKVLWKYYLTPLLGGSCGNRKRVWVVCSMGAGSQLVTENVSLETWDDSQPHRVPKRPDLSILVTCLHTGFRPYHSQGLGIFLACPSATLLCKSLSQLITSSLSSALPSFLLHPSCDDSQKTCRILSLFFVITLDLQRYYSLPTHLSNVNISCYLSKTKKTTMIHHDCATALVQTSLLVCPLMSFFFFSRTTLHQWDLLLTLLIV